MDMLLTVKNKLAEAEMRQGCTDQTPYAKQLISEVLDKLREVVEGAELSPNPIILEEGYMLAWQVAENVKRDTLQAILKAMGELKE